MVLSQELQGQPETLVSAHIFQTASSVNMEELLLLRHRGPFITYETMRHVSTPNSITRSITDSLTRRHYFRNHLQISRKWLRQDFLCDRRNYNRCQPCCVLDSSCFEKWRAWWALEFGWTLASQLSSVLMQNVSCFHFKFMTCWIPWFPFPMPPWRATVLCGSRGGRTLVTRD